MRHGARKHWVREKSQKFPFSNSLCGYIVDIQQNKQTYKTIYVIEKMEAIAFFFLNENYNCLLVSRSSKSIFNIFGHLVVMLTGAP